MTYKVYLDSVYDGDKAGVLYEGQYKPAAVAVLRACKELNQRVEMEEIKDETYGLSQTDIDYLCSELADWFADGISGCMSDIVWDGYQGIHDYSLEELISFANDYNGNDDRLDSIVKNYKASKAIEKEVLS